MRRYPLVTIDRLKLIHNVKATIDLTKKATRLNALPFGWGQPSESSGPVRAYAALCLSGKKHCAS